MNVENNSLNFIFWPYVSSYTNFHPVKHLVDRPPLLPNERLAFPHPDSIKRATLLADRIYFPCYSSHLDDIPVDLTYGDRRIDQLTAKETSTYAEVGWPFKIKDPKKKEEEFLRIFLKGPISAYRNTFPKASIFPINYEVGSSVVPCGKSHAIQGALNNIPTVIEQELQWEQILEFRKDSEAKRKYRDLHLWLEIKKDVTSPLHVTDLISQKIEDYQWAIKKHGLKTKIEAISSMLSLGSVIPTAGGFTAKAIEMNPFWGAIAGGILAVGGATVWIAKRSLELEDLKRGQHSEIAYLYDIKKLVR